jgi:hypothetical protein
VASPGLGAAFTDFMGDRLARSITQVQELSTKSTPLPTGAPKSRSRGGRHSKGKGTRKKANPMPVRKSKEIQRSNRTGFRVTEPQGCSRTGSVQRNLVRATTPARVPRVLQSKGAPTIQTRVVNPRASLYRRRAVSRFQESAVRNRMTPVGQMENMSVQVRRGAGQRQIA